MTKFKRQSGEWLLTAAAVVVCCGVLRAQAAPEMQPEAHGWMVQQQGQTEARPTVTIRTDHGNIEVHGKAGLAQVQWTARIHIRGGSMENARRHLSDEAVSVKVTGGTVEVRSNQSADLTVLVPVKLMQVMMHSGSGDLIATDIAAKANLVTDGGQIHVERLSGQVQAQTGGGNITLQNSGALGMLTKLVTGGGNITVDAADGDVLASSGGGNMMVTAARGNVKIDTGGGNVAVRQASGGLQLETGSGNIEIGDIGGNVTVETGGGTIRLASAKGAVRASTGAGSIDCRQLGGGLHADTGAGMITAEYSHNLHFTESKLETGSGDITVYLPDGLAAAVKVVAENPWGHNIRVDFPAIRLTKTSADGELRAEGVMNGGGPLLRVETGNGSVALLREK
jgi:DUF4097 and DUF4098 domain-containing protein YvlB